MLEIHARRVRDECQPRQTDNPARRKRKDSRMPNNENVENRGRELRQGKKKEMQTKVTELNQIYTWKEE